jgi:hypothetical protein
MVNIHLSGSFHLGIQEGGIVIIAFHLCQCMVEWHKSNSTEIITNKVAWSQLPSTCVNVWWNGTNPIPLR